MKKNRKCDLVKDTFNKQSGALDRFMSLKRLSSQTFRHLLSLQGQILLPHCLGKRNSAETHIRAGKKKRKETKQSSLTGPSWSVHAVTVHVITGHNTKSMLPRKLGLIIWKYNLVGVHKSKIFFAVVLFC